MYTFKKAFITTLPVMVGYIVLGMGFGIVAHDAGLDTGMILAMSLCIYAGSMQYAGVSLITAQAGMLTTVFMTLLVNARHMFYGIAMLDKYKDTKPYRPYLIFSLTDETYSLVCDGNAPEGCQAGKYYFFVSALDQFYWVLGTLAGTIFISFVNVDTTGIDFSMTALFLVTVVNQVKHSPTAFPSVVGAVVTVLCLMIFGTGVFLIPSMIGIIAVLLVCRKKVEAHV